MSSFGDVGGATLEGVSIRKNLGGLCRADQPTEGGKMNDDGHLPAASLRMNRDRPNPGARRARAISRSRFICLYTNVASFSLAVDAAATLPAARRITAARPDVDAMLDAVATLLR